MNPARVIRLLWLIAGCALILGLGRESFHAQLIAAQPLPRVTPQETTSWSGGSFRDAAVYPTTTPGQLPPNILTVGSWLDGDDWQGRTETAWFRVTDDPIHVAIAGYPRNVGCRFAAEFRLGNTRTRLVEYDRPNAHERWQLWQLTPPPGATAVRFVAEDHSTALGGWLAFSQPFSTGSARNALDYFFALTLTGTALGVLLVWGSVMLACRASASGNMSPAALRLAAVGIVAAVLAVVLVTLALAATPPRTSASIALGAWWLAIGLAVRRIATAYATIPLIRRWLLPTTFFFAGTIAHALARTYTGTAAFPPWLAVDMTPLSSLAATCYGVALVTLVWPVVERLTLRVRPSSSASAAEEPVPAYDSPRVRRVARAVVVLGAASLLVGPTRLGRDTATPLAFLDGEAGLGNGPFIAGGAHAGIDLAEVPRGLATRGSWVGSGDFKGEHTTGWYRAAAKVTLFVGGYPKVNGNVLELEVRGRGGRMQRIAFADDYPGEKWQPWLVSLPAGAEAIRIHAIDAATGPVGWLGFSEPFVAQPSLARQGWGIVQLLTATCLTFSLLYGPGLIWFQRRARPLPQLALATLHGPLLLALLGALGWSLGRWINPMTTARVGVIALLLWVWREARSRHFAWRLPREATAVIGAGALLVGFAVAKANFSYGPVGELFHHSVSRTLAVGGHSDSRISYHVTQLAANALDPFGKEADEMFSPWSFGSRGPLAGLAATPLVLATGGRPPRTLPDRAWQPFDGAGFAVYRITLIIIASFAAWVMFGVIASFVHTAWATLAAIALLLAPFFVHELYFSWPKLMAASLVLVSFQLAGTGRPLGSGAVLGIGYLFHPLALLSAPFIGLWLVLRNGAGNFPARCIAAIRWPIGLALLVVPWQIVGHLNPGHDAAQSIFLHYFHIADSRLPETSAIWWKSRWDNFAYTFIPGYLFVGDLNHESLNSFYAPSDAPVRFSFVYWNTLPFALGVPGFVAMAAGMVSACRRVPGLGALTFVGPAVFLVIYWGAACTGMMRHAGHVLFVTSIALGTWGIATSGDAWRQRIARALLHPVCFGWRAFEIAVVAFGTTFLNRWPVLQSVFGWNDALSLAAAAGCLAGAVAILMKIVPQVLSDVLNAPAHVARSTAGAVAVRSDE